MTLVYKLTDRNLQTHGGCQWEPGVARETDGSGDLCGPSWLHYYHDPLLAVLLNPIRGKISNPILWEAKAEGVHKDDRGLKGGCTRLTLLRQIDMPQITTEQRVKLAILCTKQVCADPAWNLWADDWLSGKDRSPRAARAAWSAAWATDAAGPAEAAWSAEAAAWATDAAGPAEAAWSAEAAAWAAESAARVADIDLIALAREAVGAGQ